MKFDLFIWNKYGNKAVRSSRIRNFTIEEQTTPEKVQFEVVAWINDSSTLGLGYFDTMEEAKLWLQGRLDMIESIPPAPYDGEPPMILTDPSYGKEAGIFGITHPEGITPVKTWRNKPGGQK